MARLPRLDFPGAVHHVIVKGNDGAFIFRDQWDQEKYLALLRRYQERFHFRVFGYCLMGTHVHLAIETGETPLFRVMQAWQTSYAQFFNKRHTREGHLFRGRYKAILVQVDRYLLALIRYIHRNPVEAGLCLAPERYEWSSDRYYRGDPAPAWLDTDFVLSTLGETRREARAAYLALMGDDCRLGFDDVPTSAGLVRGEESFAKELFRREKRVDLLLIGIRIEDVAEAVSATTGIPVGELRGQRRSPSLASARGLLAHVAKRFGAVCFSRSAGYLSRGESAVVKLAGRFEHELGRSDVLRDRLEDVLSRLRARRTS